MTLKPLIKAIAALALSGMMISTSANSVGFDATVYSGTDGMVEITVLYDYTTFPMFTGGLDMIFDTNAIEFVSYTQAPLPDFAYVQASPVGALTAPGVYEGFGIGSFDIFAGISAAGSFCTFVFNILGATDGTATPCGMTLCLQENSVNPFTNLFGQEVGPELLAAGNSGANVATSIPVPAAIWFMLSGLGALLGFRKSGAENRCH